MSGEKWSPTFMVANVSTVCTLLTGIAVMGAVYMRPREKSLSSVNDPLLPF